MKFFSLFTYYDEEIQGKRLAIEPGPCLICKESTLVVDAEEGHFICSSECEQILNR